MTKYMILYMAPMSSEEQYQSAGPEEGQKIMALWMTWYGKYGSIIVDGGVPLANGMDYTTNSGAKTHAPYASGYSIIQADDMDQAHKIISDHPHLMMPGSSIQVLEMMPMPTSM